MLNTRTQAKLQLQLIALADSTLHLQLDELDPLRPRYRVQESLAGDPSLSRYMLVYCCIVKCNLNSIISTLFQLEDY